MYELLDTQRLELNVSLLLIGVIILVIGLMREFLSTKAPASEVCWCVVFIQILGGGSRLYQVITCSY